MSTRDTLPPVNSLDDLYTQSLRGLRSEIERRRAGLAKSLHTLLNQDSDYARLHRRVAAVYDEVQAVVEKRLAEPADDGTTTLRHPVFRPVIISIYR